MAKIKAYDANNARNRDLYGFAKVNNLLEFSDGRPNVESGKVSAFDQKNDQIRSSNPQAVENALIDYIDSKVDVRKKKKGKKVR